MTTITQTEQALPVGTWNVDPVHSHVGFAVEYIGGIFRGTFSPVDASLVVSEDGSATLSGSAPVSGITVQDENMTAHLQSPEFFDIERTPQVSFTSTEIRRSGSEIAIEGELTIRGATLPVRLEGTIGEPADDPYGGVRFSLKLSATIDRTQFGLNWNNPLPNGEPSLANDVTLSADLYLVKA
jgi:polyisoprenoid-binding protein YceI